MKNLIPKIKHKDPAVMPVPVPPMPLQAKLDELLLASGQFYLNGKFDDDHITPIVKGITALNLLPEADQPEQITIHINSPGGTVWNLWQLTNTMAQSTIPVATIANGLAASCGFLLLMAGHKGLRSATYNSSLMSHQYSWGAAGKHHELVGRQDEFTRSDKRMIDFYKLHTGKNQKYIQEKLLPATDVWMSAEQAKKHGVIDTVIK